MGCRELSGSGRIAQRDQRCDGEADEESTAGRLGGWRPDGEDAGADHRTQTERDGVAEAEAACKSG